jgi:hypothetical protein
MMETVKHVKLCLVRKFRLMRGSREVSLVDLSVNAATVSGASLRGFCASLKGSCPSLVNETKKVPIVAVTKVSREAIEARGTVATCVRRAWRRFFMSAEQLSCVLCWPCNGQGHSGRRENQAQSDCDN